jgi:hypothetical protein
VVSEVARQVNPDSAELVDGAIRLRNDEMITRDYYVEAQHDGWEGSLAGSYDGADDDA